MEFSLLTWCDCSIRGDKEGVSKLGDGAVQLKDEGIEGAERAVTGAVGSEEGYTLSSWEREGLPPLLEVR